MVVTRDPEVLFKEARHRTRRRRVLAAGFVALIAGAAALVMVVALATSTRHARLNKGVALESAAGPVVSLKLPGTLAVSPSGTLYVVDAQRDQILRLLPTGRFTVFAGTGKHGFAGDGGPATRAELRLQGNSGLVFSRTGTAYLADTGNGRIRAVLPGGRIETIAGDGRPEQLRVGSWPARRTAIQDPVGLFLASDGELFVTATDVLKISPDGTASWFAGSTARYRFQREGYLSDGSDIGIDRAGDLLVFDFPRLYERTAAGRILDIGSLRGGRLVGGPGGVLYGADPAGVFRFTSGRPALRPPVRYVSVRRIDAAVGWRTLATLERPRLDPIDGLAVAADGDIYLDTDGDGFEAPMALVEVGPSDRVRVIWHART